MDSKLCNPLKSGLYWKIIKMKQERPAGSVLHGHSLERSHLNQVMGQGEGEKKKIGLPSQMKRDSKPRARS